LDVQLIYKVNLVPKKPSGGCYNSISTSQSSQLTRSRHVRVRLWLANPSIGWLGCIIDEIWDNQNQTLVTDKNISCYVRSQHGKETFKQVQKLKVILIVSESRFRCNLA